MRKSIRREEHGLTFVEVLIAMSIYSVLSVALFVTESNKKTDALALFDQYSDNPKSAFETAFTKLNQFGDDCDADLTKGEKALCRTSRQIKDTLAGLGLTQEDIIQFVDANPGFVEELWDVAIIFDDDEDGLVSLEELPGPGILAEDIEYEAEDLAIDFNAGVDGAPGREYSSGDLVSAWTAYRNFVKAAADEATEDKSKKDKKKKDDDKKDKKKKDDDKSDKKKKDDDKGDKKKDDDKSDKKKKDDDKGDKKKDDDKGDKKKDDDKPRKKKKKKRKE